MGGHPGRHPARTTATDPARPNPERRRTLTAGVAGVPRELPRLSEAARAPDGATNTATGVFAAIILETIVRVESTSPPGVRKKITINAAPVAHDELIRAVREAMAEGRSAGAIAALEVLAGRNSGRGEGGARTWLRLALAWQAQSPTRNATPPAEAMAAAYGAYRRAANDAERIDALSLLGNLLLQQMGRQNVADDTSSDAQPVDHVENWEATKRLAYRIFTELGRLAGARHLADGQAHDSPPNPR